jgi:hypothetical protein
MAGLSVSMVLFKWLVPALPTAAEAVVVPHQRGTR